MPLKRNMLCSKPAKLHVFHLQRCSIYYTLRRNYYFIQFGSIFILCPSTPLLFYALQRNFTHLGTIYILCASTRLLFYARQRNFMQGNFRHWQASTPIVVVLKWRGRLRACSQRLPRRFNTIAPLWAEDCQWLFSLSCLHLGGSKSAKVQNCQRRFSLSRRYL